VIQWKIGSVRTKRNTEIEIWRINCAGRY